MVTYNISVDLAAVAQAASAAIDEYVFPLLGRAVNAVAQQAQANWMQSVYQAKLWQGEKDAYAQSIQIKMTGPFSATIETDYANAFAIETGRPARDLKRMLNTSHKVRRTMDGRRFLIIPFQHNIPGSDAIGSSMPAQVYAQAYNLAPSRVTGQGLRRAGEVVSARVGRGMTPLGEKRQRRSPYLTDAATRAPAMVTRRDYQWGERMAGGLMGPESKGKADRFAGMVRFDTNAGGKRSSVYMTFRKMQEGQSGWIVPAMPGLYLAQDVAKKMQPLAEKVFGEAIRRSL